MLAYCKSNRNANSDYMIDSLVRSGKIIGARDEKSNSVNSIFPRRYRFLSRLSGTATVEKNNSCIVMTENVSREIRQGDAIIIRDVVYRGRIEEGFSRSGFQSREMPAVCEQHAFSGRIDRQTRSVAKERRDER